MREFVRNAVMERRMCTAEKKVNISCNPPPKDGVHNSSTNVFVCVPPLVNFVVDIVLKSFPFSCTEATGNEKYFV